MARRKYQLYLTTCIVIPALTITAESPQEAIELGETDARERFHVVAVEAGGSAAALADHWSGDFDVQAVPYREVAEHDLATLTAVGQLLDRVMAARRSSGAAAGPLLEALRVELIEGRLPKWRELRAISARIQSNREGT